MQSAKLWKTIQDKWSTSRNKVRVKNGDGEGTYRWKESHQSITVHGYYLYTDWNKQKKLMRQLVNLIIDWVFGSKELL